MIDLTETTTGAIHDALRQARLRLGGVASGMVLTLVIVTDEGAQYDAVRAASVAARQHPCRILVVIIRRPGAAVPAGRRDPGGRDQPGRDGAAAHVRAARPARGLGGGPAAAARHARGHLVAGHRRPPSRRRIRWARWPSGGSPTPPSADAPRDVLTTLAAGYQPGDTDLSWTRATPWRSLLAATMDQPSGPVIGGTVSAEAGQPDRRPDRGLAVARARRPVRHRALGRAGHHRGQLRHQRRRASRSPGRTAGSRTCAGPGSPSAGSPCTAGTRPSCSRRNCAGSTPTRSTPRPSPSSGAAGRGPVAVPREAQPR